MQYNMIKQLFFLLAIITLFSACNNDELVPNSEVEETVYEIAYGGSPYQKLDLYLPANRTVNTKLVVFVHGGGWNAGDKSDFTVLLSALKGNGFAYANINYRFADADAGITLDDLAADVRDAINFLIAKSGSFVYAPDQIIIAGHSAGGHLALYTAYNNNADGVIKAAISLAGPTDVTDPYFVNTPELSVLVENLTGGSYPEDSILWINASPITYVNSTSPPTLLQYCGLDFTVPANQGEMLQTKLNEFGVENEYHFYPFYSHDMGTIFNSGYLPDDVRLTLLNFIATHAN